MGTRTDATTAFVSEKLRWYKDKTEDDRDTIAAGGQDIDSGKSTSKSSSDDRNGRKGTSSSAQKPGTVGRSAKTTSIYAEGPLLENYWSLLAKTTVAGRNFGSALDMSFAFWSQRTSPDVLQRQLDLVQLRLSRVRIPNGNVRSRHRNVEKRPGAGAARGTRTYFRGSVVELLTAGQEIRLEPLREHQAQLLRHAAGEHQAQSKAPNVHVKSADEEGDHRGGEQLSEEPAGRGQVPTIDDTRLQVVPVQEPRFFEYSMTASNYSHDDVQDQDRLRTTSLFEESRTSASGGDEAKTAENGNKGTTPNVTITKPSSMFMVVPIIFLSFTLVFRVHVDHEEEADDRASAPSSVSPSTLPGQEQKQNTALGSCPEDEGVDDVEMLDATERENFVENNVVSYHYSQDQRFVRNTARLLQGRDGHKSGALAISAGSRAPNSSSLARKIFHALAQDHTKSAAGVDKKRPAKAAAHTEKQQKREDAGKIAEKEKENENDSELPRNPDRILVCHDIYAEEKSWLEPLFRNEKLNGGQEPLAEFVADPVSLATTVGLGFSEDEHEMSKKHQHDVAATKVKSLGPWSLSQQLPTFVHLRWDLIEQANGTYHRDEVLQFLCTLLRPEQDQKKILLITGLCSAFSLEHPPLDASDAGNKKREKNKVGDQGDKDTAGGGTSKQRNFFEKLFSADQLLEDVAELLKTEQKCVTPDMDWNLPLRAAMSEVHEKHEHDNDETLNHGARVLDRTPGAPAHGTTNNNVNHDDTRTTAGLRNGASTSTSSTGAPASARNTRDDHHDDPNHSRKPTSTTPTQHHAIPWKSHINNENWLRYQQRNHENTILAEKLKVCVVGLTIGAAGGGKFLYREAWMGGAGADTGRGGQDDQDDSEEQRLQLSTDLVRAREKSKQELGNLTSKSATWRSFFEKNAFLDKDGRTMHLLTEEIAEAVKNVWLLDEKDAASTTTRGPKAGADDMEKRDEHGGQQAGGHVDPAAETAALDVDSSIGQNDSSVQPDVEQLCADLMESLSHEDETFYTSTVTTTSPSRPFGNNHQRGQQYHNSQAPLVQHRKDKLFGLQKQRQELADAILWPRFLPHYFEAMGLTDASQQQAVLLTGPSGSGKTFLGVEWLKAWLERFAEAAAAAATASRRTKTRKEKARKEHWRVRVVHATELISSFVGESEENLRRILNDDTASRGASAAGKQDAADIVPDEGDAALQQNDNELLVFENIDQWLARPDDDNDDATGAVRNRLLTTFLVALDGIDSRTERNAGPQRVLVCTTTKPAENFPPSILRPGRLKPIAACGSLYSRKHDFDCKKEEKKAEIAFHFLKQDLDQVFSEIEMMSSERNNAASTSTGAAEARPGEEHHQAQIQKIATKILNEKVVKMRSYLEAETVGAVERAVGEIFRTADSVAQALGGSA
ncbi:unnamed protein product [Amoebophrya sp. A120]|nr:unnamed protein product [Amoebophrya sp. A120]|eukprot:GSA120T00007760001.1